jgi:CBS domain-containing protein
MTDIFVGRLMSSPVRTVSPGTPIQEAARKMSENRIGSVIVVGDGGLEGILTATDFVRLGADGRSAVDTAVSEYMSTDVVTAEANDDIREIADLMIENGFHHVPVVDDAEGVVGIITTTDLTAYLSHVKTPSPG